MGKRLFKKTEAANIQGLCVKCKTNLQHSNGKTASGERKYRPICFSCHNKRVSNDYFEARKVYRARLRKPYKVYKVDECSRCGMKAEHPAQMDVDHIDGNHHNNSPENLWTLCACCHRLKTVLERETLEWITHELWEKKRVGL